MIRLATEHQLNVSERIDAKKKRNQLAIEARRNAKVDRVQNQKQSIRMRTDFRLSIGYYQKLAKKTLARHSITCLKEYLRTGEPMHAEKALIILEVLNSKLK
jgi:hypothetical protein